MEKISIIGPSGSGKSYLAKQLGEILGLPVIHLDRHFWQPNWGKPDRTEFQQRIIKMLGNKWIVDGTHILCTDLLEYRFKHADMTIYLNIPLDECIRHVTERSKEKVRDDIPDFLHETPETFDKLIEHIKVKCATFQKTFYEYRDKYANGKFLEFTTREQVDNFLRFCYNTQSPR